MWNVDSKRRAWDINVRLGTKVRSSSWAKRESCEGRRNVVATASNVVF